MSAKESSATNRGATSALFALACKKDGTRHMGTRHMASHSVYHKHRRRWAGLHWHPGVQRPWPGLAFRPLGFQLHCCIQQINKIIRQNICDQAAFVEIIDGDNIQYQISTRDLAPVSPHLMVGYSCWMGTSTQQLWPGSWGLSTASLKHNSALRNLHQLYLKTDSSSYFASLLCRR
jgi:hypothetical protein